MNEIQHFHVKARTAKNGSLLSVVFPILFIAVVMGFGGAAQFNRLSDVPVRVIAVCALAWLWAAKLRRPAPLRPAELTLVLLCLTIPIIQLLPLPPSTWSLLGDRAAYVGAYRDIDAGPLPWLPISIEPDRSIDALFFLLVPAAGFLLGRRLSRGSREAVLLALLGMVAANILAGVIQVGQGSTSPMRFYAVTNAEGPVGFFANRNHFALLMAIAPVIAAWAASGRRQYLRGPATWVLWAATAISCFAMALLTESRAGTVLAVCGLLASVIFLFRRGGGGREAPLIAGAAVAASVALLAILQFTSLGERFARLVHDNPRADITPQLAHAAWNNLPFGSGVGSFEALFRRYETVTDLAATYWNHAHDDLAQIIIEAGLPGLVAVLLLIIWWGGLLKCAWRSGDSKDRELLWMILVTTAMILLHSLVDYPLRTPAFAGLFAFLAGAGSRVAGRNGARV